MIGWLRNGTISHVLEADAMATLTIKNVPEPLVRRLKRRAAAHRRSLNLEVISCLETTVRATPLDAQALLARVRAIRRSPVDGRLSEALLRRLKSSGRP
jgi:antitoxin FitA